MKRIIVPSAFLFSFLNLSAAEAWLLEMDARFHDALMKRFSTGDPAACTQVTDKFPGLVKSGKIKELERISSSSGNGGKFHPTAKFMLKAKDETENPINVGTTYIGGSGAADERRFLIKSAGEGLGAKLAIKVTGRLSKAWQPTFSAASSGVVRVLLERDPNATEAFWKTEGLLTLSAPVPENATFTWLLGEGHPLLSAGTEEVGDFPSLAEFHDITTRAAQSGDDWRDFGTIVKWTIKSDTGPCYDL